MDIASFMTWIRETIMKMGGMQTCDLVYEETNPEGHFFQDIFTVGTNIGYTRPIFVNFWKQNSGDFWYSPCATLQMCPQIVCLNNCITIFPFVRSLCSNGSFRCFFSKYFTEQMESLMAWLPICNRQWLSKWFKSDDDNGDGDCNIVISIITI